MKKEQKDVTAPSYKVTINSLVRANLHALLRDRAMRDKAFNKHGQKCFEILKVTYRGPHRIEDHINIDEWLRERNPDRWSRMSFGEISGVGGGKMNRLLDDVSERKPQEFELVDLMKIARALEIPYGFLFYPSRQQLEQNATLMFEDFKPVLQITALHWLSWAAGLSVLPGMDAVASNFNSLVLTNSPMPGESFAPGEEGYPGTSGSDEIIQVDLRPVADTQSPLDLYETRRISEGLTSDVSSALEAMGGNPFTPNPAAQIPIDNSSLKVHAINKAKFVTLLLHDVREAFYLVSDNGRLEFAGMDIENSLNKIKQDLAAFALNLDEGLHAPNGPLTKSHLINMLELTCMKLENIDLEWTLNSNTKIK